MIEWFVENMVIIGIVVSIIAFALWAYQYVAWKYNLTIWKWLKNVDFNKGGTSGPGGP